MIPRLASSRLQSLVAHFPVTVLTGARQVGKTTLLRSLFPGAAGFVCLDPVVDVENARADPDLFLDNHRTPLVLDEIQYAPELVAAIKRRVDLDRKPGQYILTGSQQWGVMRGLSESLAGRVVFQDLHGFCLAELSDPATGNWLEAWLAKPEAIDPAQAPVLREDLYKQLFRGFLPEAQFLPVEHLRDFHRGYLRTYIERDVRMLADLSDLHSFSRFVQLAGALSAQEINHSQLGREIGVTPQTARRWLDILRGSCQWMEIPPWSGNAIKRISGRPKGYLLDSGLICHLQAISSPEALGGHPMLGHLFETAVVADLLKLGSAMSAPPLFHHWRSHGGAEVDLVLERDGRFFPIEIKLSSHPSKNDARGISAFRASYPELTISPGLVIAPAASSYPLNDLDRVLPWIRLRKES